MSVSLSFMPTGVPAAAAARAQRQLCSRCQLNNFLFVRVLLYEPFLREGSRFPLKTSSGSIIEHKTALVFAKLESI